MEVGLVPGHELSVVPDDPIEAVIGLGSHGLLLRHVCLDFSGLAAVMVHFSRPFQHFTSLGYTRYEWARTGPIEVLSAPRAQKGPFRYDPFVYSGVFVT